MFAKPFTQYVAKIYDKITSTLGFGESLKIEDDGTTYTYVDIDQDTILGHVSKETDPYRAYSFDQNSKPAYIRVDPKGYAPDIFVTNFGGGWEWADEENICDHLAIVELHELTHWAEEAQGNFPESGGYGHSDRWNTVLREEVDWIQDGESTIDTNCIDIIDLLG